MKSEEYLLTVLERPHLSEKTVGQGLLAFRVRKSATKEDVRQAVEKIFGKQVSGVRIVNSKGKPRRFGGITGRKKSFKKAYVSFSDGILPDIESIRL